MTRNRASSTGEFHPALWLAAAATFAAANGAIAQTRTWDAGGGTNVFTTADNWSDNDVPDTADEDVLIDGNPDAAISTTLALTSGTFTVGNAVIDLGDEWIFRGGATSSGGSLVLSSLANAGEFDMASGGSGNVRSATVTIAGDDNFSNAAGGLVLVGNLSGNNRVHVVLNIAAQNSNAGDITISKGSSLDRSSARVQLTGTGTFTNNGTITIRNSVALSGGEGGAHLNFAGDTLLSGDGEIIMETATNERTMLYAVTSGAMLTNGVNHTIRGAGVIGAGDNTYNSAFALGATANLINDGLIVADDDDMFLRLLPQSTVTNSATGRIVASGAAGLTFGSTTARTFTNDGLLESRAGSHLSFTTASVLNLNGQIRGGGSITATSLALSGTATLAPGDSANANGTGASTVGTLSLFGNLSLSEGTTLSMQLGDDSLAGTSYDTIAVTGDLTLDGVLNVHAVEGFDSGTYTLFTYAGNGMDNGLTMPGDDDTYVMGGGVVNLTIAPEPATLSLIVLAGCGLLARRRKDRH